MDVLLMTRDLSELGGTQTWTQTMAKAIQDKGHNVFAWSFRTGLKMPCPTTTELEKLDYDLIIINHNTVMGYSHFKKLTGTRVFTSHGPLHPLERTAGGADHYAGVSEEVVMVQAEQGYMADIIRQPIDLGKFYSDDARWPRQMLITPKRGVALNEAVAACESAGIDYDIAHYQINPIDEMWNLLPQYDVVISAGRGILEALACGCQVFSFNGENHSDGWITPENIGKASQCNYSGRATQKNYVGNQMADLLRDPPPHSRFTLREWVEEHHDASDIADKYLAYADADTADNTLHPIHRRADHEQNEEFVPVSSD